MGCTGSKQARIERHHSPSPVDRCYSMPVYHRPQRRGDNRHVVALTSTTLGSLRLDPLREGCGHRGCPHCSREVVEVGDEPTEKTVNYTMSVVPRPLDDVGLSAELLKAKAWSEIIEKKIPAPRTPTKTPPNEPEVINTWELMEGLEDASPFYRYPATGGAAPPVMERSFSFHSVQETRREAEPKAKAKRASGSVSPEPMWMKVDGDEENTFISEFDPDVISSFRKAFEELSPIHPFHLTAKRPVEPELSENEGPKKKDDDCKIPALAGIVKARISVFQEKIDAKKARFAASRPCYKPPPGSEGKVVFYFTSLRGVRRTYEDCCTVRVILRGYAVRVDERDVSMHRGFKEELDAIMGSGFGGNRLPRVFANGKYLGGAEEVRQMHDAGDLWKALEGCEELLSGKDASCRACGDVRFMPCETCSGSCKVYVEEGSDKEADPKDIDIDSGGFRRCPDCNENGLVRCPVCCGG